MTDNLPAPLTPPDCDLRDFPFMPLLIERLRRSRAWLICRRRPELAFFLLNLWMRSWHEVPAASIEDDEDVLADAAMADPKRWAKLRADLLRGWVKCSDGRLYHPTVAEAALDAFAKKTKQRARTQAASRARHGGAERPVTVSVTENVTENVTTSVTDGNNIRDVHQGTGTGTGREKGEKRESPPPSVPVPRARVAADGTATAVVDGFLAIRQALWPNESRLPAPTLTIEDEARQFLAAGGTVDLILDVVEQQAKRKLAQHEHAPGSLGFCRMSIENAIARRTRNGAPPAAPPARTFTAAEEEAATRYKRALYQAQLDGIDPRDPSYPKPPDLGRSGAAA